MILHKKNASYLLASVCLSPVLAMAQTAPTAGQILQQETKPPRASTIQTPRTEIEEAPSTRSDNEELISVSAIHFSGNTVFSEATLHTLVAGSITPGMTLDALNQLANRVTRYYREHGYMVARAWLPPQDISNGEITIAVLEGQMGQVVLDNQTGVAANAVSPLKRLKSGEAINSQTLEDTLLRLADLPGTEVKSTLRPGESVGTSDFIVNLLPAKRLTGSLDVDNFGNRFAGAERIGTSVYWNNPADIGDQASLRLQVGNNDFRYGRIGYQLPFGPYATRIGAAYSTMYYELGKGFSSLDAHGQANVASFYLQQPLLRHRNASWYASFQYDDKHLHDDIDATQMKSRKVLRNATASIYGNFSDTLGGGASTNLGLSYTRGKTEMDALSTFIDRFTARSGGRFGKWNLNVQRQQQLPGRWLLAINANAQWAEKNLDASEKMLLGGSANVRAYPQGEASGDSGYTASFELHHAITGNWEGFIFYDEGRVRINQAPWQPNLANHRSLSGYGLGVTWIRGSYSIQSFAAWKGDTGRSFVANGNGAQVWVQAVMGF